MIDSHEKQRVTFVITFDDDRRVIEQIDQIAKREYLTRSDIIRRALRFFLTNSPSQGTIPQEVQADTTDK